MVIAGLVASHISKIVWGGWWKFGELYAKIGWMVEKIMTFVLDEILYAEYTIKHKNFGKKKFFEETSPN